MSMEDSFGSPGRQNQRPTETDIKQALNDMEEVAQVLEVVEEFERDYFAAKKKMNPADLATLEASATSQALKLSYQIIQGHLRPENPNFDQEKMEP